MKPKLSLEALRLIEEIQRNRQRRIQWAIRYYHRFRKWPDSMREVY